MEKPEEEIADVIRSLTMGTREEQKEALDNYFLPDAYFVHPFCRVPSFKSRPIQVPFINKEWIINSRLLVLFVYQWYKIMSPKILLKVDSTSFDRKTNSLYVTIRQTFTLWIVPFSLWQANVKLVCLLKLMKLDVDENRKPLLPRNRRERKNHNKKAAMPYPKSLYFIHGQQDHYQSDDMLKFIAPLGASALYYLWQLLATFLCIIGATLLWPVTSVYERHLNKATQKGKGNGHEAN
ncbi:hypothetical protein GGS24DRAFT_85511 [Hypoxylon argillaceum]|nr:hypothetical protein GGS24DRAFT_85511 [Hypoxylon argillaceum]